MVKNVRKTKNSRVNATSSKKGIIIQQTQRNPIVNSSTTVLRKSKPRQQKVAPRQQKVAPRQQQKQPVVNAKRNATTVKPPTSVKLPTIVKKTSTTTTTVKPTPSAYIQDSSKKPLQVPPSTVVKKPSPPKLLKPFVVQQSLPVIKNHVIQENLTLKPTLKCKSPRPESLYSRSNTFVVNEVDEKTKTRHPLQHMNVGSLLSESASHRLKRLFNKLDTDKDGHLLYTELQKCLPPNLPRAQLTFFRVLYDIISNTTYFGLQEFYAIAIIVDMVAQQDSTLWNTFLDDVDFNYYHNHILELLEEFNDRCLSNTGTINYENLLELIMKRTTYNKIERIKNQVFVEYVIPKIKRMKINRLDFISLLPAIVYIQSCFDHGKTLFRFHENSLLDSHMRQAILTSVY